MSENTPTYRPRCMHLCCKSMVVYGENFENDPDYQAGQTSFWCVQTCKSQGPDGEHVSLDACSNAERQCFQLY